MSLPVRAGQTVYTACTYRDWCRWPSTEDIGDPGYDIPYTTGPSEPATVIKESPHLNMFHGHVPIQVTLDSGAKGNLISSHAAKHIGAHFQPTSQGAHQADGNSPLEVVGETHLTLTMDHKVFHFEGLVVNNLDGDILGGVPFMAHNDISVRPARREVVFGDGSAVIYPSDNTTDSASHCTASPHSFLDNLARRIYQHRYSL